ncbi:MAG: TonB-dependent receptor [Thiobacillus sp.]|nr:TonB-dependent receptor [Thiobacillus sp.]
MNHLIKITGKFLMVAACMAEPIHATEITESSNAVELDVIVVTATRSALSLADAPAAVTVVDAKKIETKNVSRLGDALDQVPSLYLQNGAFGPSQGTSGTSGLSLRGIDQNKTLILLDGQPIQDASSGKVNWRIPFVEDIERIEIIPGAFSSLYGSNAIGGVINVITKQPDRREFSAKLKKGWNDLSGEDGSVYFRDTLESGLGIVAGVGYQKRDSFVNDFVVKTPIPGAGTIPVTGWQAITTRDGLPAYLVGDKGRTPWTSANATLKLSYKLDARDKVFGGVSYQETNQDYTFFNTYLRNTMTGAPVSSGSLDIDGKRVTLAEFDFVNNSPLHEAATRYFAGYEGTIGKDTLLKLDLAKIDRAYSFTAAGATSSWNSGPGTLTDTPNSGLDGSIQLSFPMGEKQFWVTGLSLHRDEVNQKIYALSNWRDDDSRIAVNNGYNGSSTTTSLYGQNEITLSDTLKAYLGGRWDYWETRGDYFNTAATLFPSRNDSAFSPKASAVYKPVEAVTLRASFGRSFRAPANLDLYSTSVSRGRTTHNNPNLEPETGTTWEVGGEWRFTNTTQAGLTLYETRLENLIYLKQADTSTTRESFRINAGKARVRGIELTARTRLTNWLELDANYAYIESEMLENAADLLSVGKRLIDSPKNIAGIGLTAQQGPWTGTLSARYVSHVFFTAQNTDVVEDVPGSYDAYTLVNAKAGYAFSKTVKASLAINNLLDEKAYSFFLLPGRSATAELDFSF